MGSAQDKKKFVPNYDEDKVPEFTLPDPLAPPGVDRVTTKEDWEKSGRQATFDLIAREMYGVAPGPIDGITATLEHEVDDALGGKAIRREYLVSHPAEGAPKVRLLLYLPKGATKPVPAFLGLNFRGNHTVEKDPRISTNDSYVLGANRDADAREQAEKNRGTASGRWPAAMIVERGYALATACCGQIDPDFDDGFKNGVHAMFPVEGERPAEAWGTVAGWAWGLSRLLDVLEEVSEVDATKVAVLGHSRLGKTSLWAGAQDERFALVISNNSGCGGAALSKRAFGETVGRINRSFPHWFNGNFKKYNENEGELTFDQHQLIALIAPRPVYVASATGDRWADPKGEFLSLVHAEPVYALYGGKPLGVNSQPPAGASVGGVMGYHLREGKHDITPEDWGHYLDFADRWLRPVK